MLRVALRALGLGRQACSLNRQLITNGALASRIIPTMRMFSAAAEEASVSTGNRQVSHIRNVAVIAHVDHGKTTLVDQLLKQSGVQTDEDRCMDSISLEKERGITIMSKNTSVEWNGMLMNIVDTPGHQDFGGEVERVLSMVDGVLLVVDATEGPMAQTKFVLSKALQNKLRPVVVINKVDRDSARLGGEVEDELFELFLQLNASDSQMDFPILYASAKAGWCVSSLDDERKDITALYQAIATHVPPPTIHDHEHFSMLVTTIEYDNYVGRVVTGKVYSGTAKVGGKVYALTREGKPLAEARVTKIYRRRGLARLEVEVAEAGDIVSIAGMPDATVTDTVCSPEVTAPLPSIPIDPPTIAMTFSVNDSPLGGKTGTKLTSTMIKERLLKECESNVTLEVKMAADSDSFEVHGRGELQLGILIEQMRREGFEVSISPPRVLYRETKDGTVEEPWEDVTIDVPPDYTGAIINSLQERGGEMVEYKQDEHSARLQFLVPSRGLMGFRSELKSQTSGQAVVNSLFSGYRKKKELQRSNKGKLVSTADGVATAYALKDIEPRGELFIKPADKVYKGMVIGESARDSDVEVNPARTKKLTNIRAAGADEGIRLAPPRLMSLEDSIAYLAGDDQHMIEITPNEIRLRRRYLNGPPPRR